MKRRRIWCAVWFVLTAVVAGAVDSAEIAALKIKAEAGEAAAQNSLGKMYEGSSGVPVDYGEAVKWYRRAADQGFAEAQNLLGRMYVSGAGVPKDHAEAVKWFRKAADQGYADAQQNLGVMYFKGAGLPQDGAEGIRWVRKAADQGGADAQLTLGLLLSSGSKGVPSDSAEAAKWYRKAADQGIAHAQYFLGSMYATGEGVQEDLVQAHAWLSLAGAQGNGDAKKNLALINDEMTSAQKTQATKLAKELSAKIAANKAKQ
jgi:TPR repeat protein